MSFSNQKHITIQQLYTSRKTIVEYLKKQGYDTTGYDTFTMSEISAMKQSTKDSDSTTCFDFEVSLDNYNFKNNVDKTRTCKVSYYLKPSTIKQNILENMVLEYFEGVEHKENVVFVLIMQGNINDTIKKTISNMWKKYKEHVVVFEIKTLMFNVFEHCYVPEHKKLEQQEKNELFEKMNIQDENQLPEISLFDPVAKAMFMKPGDVCKITRHDIISFQNDFYRICVI